MSETVRSMGLAYSFGWALDLSSLAFRVSALVIFQVRCQAGIANLVAFQVRCQAGLIGLAVLSSLFAFLVRDPIHELPNYFPLLSLVSFLSSRRYAARYTRNLIRRFKPSKAKVQKPRDKGWIVQAVAD